MKSVQRVDEPVDYVGFAGKAVALVIVSAICTYGVLWPFLQTPLVRFVESLSK